MSGFLNNSWFFFSNEYITFVFWYKRQPEIITNRGYPLEIHHITTGKCALSCRSHPSHVRLLKKNNTHTHIHRHIGFQMLPTDDGYILELHRIPPRGPRPPSLHYSNTGQRVSSRNETNWHRRHSYRSQGPGRARPIYLQHGVMSSSACWLINPSDSSLGIYKLLQPHQLQFSPRCVSKIWSIASRVGYRTF